MSFWLLLLCAANALAQLQSTPSGTASQAGPGNVAFANVGRVEQCDDSVASAGMVDHCLFRLFVLKMCVCCRLCGR